MTGPDKPRPSVFVCCGPTGGHFYPALVFAQTLRTRHPEVEIFFVVSKCADFIERALAENGFEHQSLDLRPPCFSGPFEAARALARWFRVFFESLVLLSRKRAGLAVSFGSFAAVPPVLAASFLQIPILIHEQNVIPGNANRFLSPWANRIAVSFAETARWFPKALVAASGYPLRAEFSSDGKAEVSRADGPGCFRILVLGGSQGAERINAVFLESIQRMTAEERSNLAVIHIAGAGNQKRLERAYESLGIRAFELHGFTDGIAEKMVRADLVVSRAGAGTIFELAALSRPSILIPYPHAYRHQEANAEYLASRNAARLVQEIELSPIRLASEIRALRKAPEDRAELGRRLNSFVQKEACDTLTELAWSLL